MDEMTAKPRATNATQAMCDFQDSIMAETGDRFVRRMKGPWVCPTTARGARIRSQNRSPSQNQNPSRSQNPNRPRFDIGRVSDSAGRVGSVVVDLFADTDTDTDGDRDEWLGDTRTESDGGFSFEPLANGCYVLTFIAPTEAS